MASYTLGFFAPRQHPQRRPSAAGRTQACIAAHVGSCRKMTCLPLVSPAHKQQPGAQPTSSTHLYQLSGAAAAWSRLSPKASLLLSTAPQHTIGSPLAVHPPFGAAAARSSHVRTRTPHCRAHPQTLAPAVEAGPTDAGGCGGAAARVLACADRAAVRICAHLCLWAERTPRLRAAGHGSMGRLPTAGVERRQHAHHWKPEGSRCRQIWVTTAR